ncbi:MAG: TonB-dependent receptor, partial [Novosphingobium sp.]|nr:TonB-dependent receptor [Novosphingobium sp.]
LLPPYTGFAATNPPANRFEAAMDQRNTDDLNVAGGSATINYSTGGFTFTSISAYRDVKETIFSDGDNSATDIIHSGPFTDHSRFATQELRIVSPSDKPFRYVAGLFYQNEIATSHRDIYIGGSLAGGAVTDARIATDTYAAYANANLDLGSRVTLTGGLRYNIENKDGSYSQVRQTVPTLTFNFPDLARKDRALSWTASARYKPTENISIYGTVSRGFKSGGFNVDLASDARTTPALLNFAPEKLTNYEAGVKARLFDRHLQLSASIFHLDYKDRQVSQFVGSGGPLPSVYVTNAGASKTDGGEVEATLYLPHNFTLNASYSHLRARYTSFPNATSAGASYSGNVTELTPNNTFSIVADQRIELGSGAITYNAAARYTGKTYFDAANVASNTQDGFWLFDARLGYAFSVGSGKNELEVYVWGKNLSNKDYLVFRRQYNGANQGLYGDPRTYGVGARMKF